MIGQNLIEQIKDLFMRLNQEEISTEDLDELNDSTIEQLESKRYSLLMELGEYTYPEFHNLY